jgi:uncharacterized protein YciI
MWERKTEPTWGSACGPGSALQLIIVLYGEFCVKLLFAVTRKRGPAWDQTQPLRAQEEWTEHAAFMDQLAADGFVMLGGPVGESGDVLLIINAADEGEINTTLARDPWSQSGMLDAPKIQRWTILLESGAKV